MALKVFGLLALVLPGFAQDLFLEKAAASPHPHIVFFLSDDLGWNNVGFHSELVQTPAIDRLRAQGVELARHYAYKFCSPSRSSFLSGRLPVHVNELNKITEAPLAGVHPNMTIIPAQLKKAGYKTHHIGKWHAGFSSRSGHLPVRRGFDTSLAYFHGAEDHYTQRAGGNVDCGEQFADFWLNDGPAIGLNGTNYSLYIYHSQARQLLLDHDPSVPFFLYFAFDNNHEPLQVPPHYKEAYTTSNGKVWQTYQAMISAVDEVIGDLVDLLEAKGMWQNSIVIWTSDNGGPVYLGGGANNYPLRGGKVTDWEGGFRVPAVVSGGLLPEGRRNSTYHGITHFADWYATFCALAGLPSAEDARAAAAGLPPVDGHDLSGAIFRGDASPWAGQPLLLASNFSDKAINPDASVVLLQDDHKVIFGKTMCSEWQAPVSPNASFPQGVCSHQQPGIHSCGAGCLFDVSSDPGEHVDLAKAKPELLASLRAAAEKEVRAFYRPDRGDPGKAPCKAAREAGGYWAPYLP